LVRLKLKASAATLVRSKLEIPAVALMLTLPRLRAKVSSVKANVSAPKV
jgi:hypothetical protein